MSVRKLSMKQALEVLGIQTPKARKGMTQAQLDEEVRDWKENELVECHKQRRWHAHPDRGGSNKEFIKVDSAFHVIRANLRLRIPAAKISYCRVCKARRDPEGAKFCHACGERFVGVEMNTCPVCEGERAPQLAGFCHECGYDYKKPDPLMDRLRREGIPEAHVQKLKREGTIDRKRRLNPFGPELQQWIDHEKIMARAATKGLGRSPWGF